jgi:hypothetical protein
MEHVNADSHVWEASFGKSNEAAMHVTSEEAYLLPCFKVEGKEIRVELV